MGRNDGFQNLAGSIAKESPYARKEVSGRKLMSVAEMGRILGLGKTDRYWLLHKGFFETRVINRKTWVEIASFEKWYSGQVKYRKVDGEEPGRDLNEQSYSVRDVARMLDLSEATVYELIKRDGIPTIKVDYWMRIPKEMARLLGIPREKVYGIVKTGRYRPYFEVITIAGRKRITKESFESFLDGQSEYRLDPKNTYEEIVREDNVKLAELRRKKISERGGVRRGNGNQAYLTIQEAAFLAGLSRATVERMIFLGRFPVRKSGGVVRIPRKEFEEWMAERRTEHGINS